MTWCHFLLGIGNQAKALEVSPVCIFGQSNQRGSASSFSNSAALVAVCLAAGVVSVRAIQKRVLVYIGAADHTPVC